MKKAPNRATQGATRASGIARSTEKSPATPPTGGQDVTDGVPFAVKATAVKATTGRTRRRVKTTDTTAKGGTPTKTKSRTTIKTRTPDRTPT